MPKKVNIDEKWFKHYAKGSLTFGLDGYTARDLAIQFNCSERTAIRWAKKLGIKLNPNKRRKVYTHKQLLKSHVRLFKILYVLTTKYKIELHHIFDIRDMDKFARLCMKILNLKSLKIAYKWAWFLWRLSGRIYLTEEDLAEYDTT